MTVHDFLNVLCPQCGLSFALPAQVGEVWRAARRVFACPNRHAVRLAPPRHPGRSRGEVARLRGELVLWRHRAEQFEARAERASGNAGGAA